MTTPRIVKVGSRKHGNKQVATVLLTRHGWQTADNSAAAKRLWQVIAQLAKRGYATEYQEVTA